MGKKIRISHLVGMTSVHLLPIPPLVGIVRRSKHMSFDKALIDLSEIQEKEEYDNLPALKDLGTSKALYTTEPRVGSRVGQKVGPKS